MRKKLYPWAVALPQGFSVKCAMLWKLGELKAPGTWGSVAGILLYALLFDGMGFWRYLIFATLLAYLAVGICDTAERTLRLRDPGCIILDEFVAIPFCFIPISSSYSMWGVFLGFLLFRFFDIRKPSIIYKMQDFEGGLGCVADDVAAAFATCITLNIVGLVFNFIYI